jgi:hypothetical protein
MVPLANAQCDAQGRFRFEQTAQGPVLVQAAHQGVNYSTTIQPGASTSGVEIEVFDISKTPGEAGVSQHIFMFEPSEKELAVTESFFYSNKGKTTYYDRAAGAVRVSVPDAAAATIQVTVTGPNSLPLPRTAEKAGRANVYKVDFPIKPGESRIDVNYKLPFTSPGKFSGRSFQKAGQTRLVAPAGVELKGGGLESIGREPRSQAQIFEIAGGAFEVEISGTGSIRGAEATSDDEDSGPGIQQILPRIYDRAGVVVGITLAILALGFLMLYRRQEPEPPAPAEVKAGPRGKRRT